MAWGWSSSHPTKVGPERGPRSDLESRPSPVTTCGAAADTETCRPRQVRWGHGGRDGEAQVALTPWTFRIGLGLVDGRKRSGIDQRSVACFKVLTWISRAPDRFLGADSPKSPSPRLPSSGSLARGCRVRWHMMTMEGTTSLLPAAALSHRVA